MTLSEYIHELRLLEDDHGEERVVRYVGPRITTAGKPEARKIATLKGRETKLRFLQPWQTDREAQENVIMI